MRINNFYKVVSKPIYKVYEKILWNQIKNGPFPKHVGIIPDGNRRWARSYNLNIDNAYFYGYKKLKEVLIWLLDLGIKNVTVFALSTENCERRNKYELEYVLKYIKQGLEDLLTNELIEKREVKVRAIGRLSQLPDDINQLIEKVTKKTENYNKHKLTLAICYGGRQEILDAVKKIIIDVESDRTKVNELLINEENFKKYFYDPELEDLDLVIRTSGEVRISNFLLWHLAYSELFFCEAYWPDFRKIDLWRAIRSYQKRKRNFGA
ncbi:MAG: polyprenyl diphosphate synthase [Sulfolobaceae archaeon]|nr:polyprenyl diphosphate synthase [Sulfolobaceae archaeon]